MKPTVCLNFGFASSEIKIKGAYTGNKALRIFLTILPLCL
jgi:hypothetical protein